MAGALAFWAHCHSTPHRHAMRTPVIARIAFAFAAAMTASTVALAQDTQQAQDPQQEGVTRREVGDWTVLCSADGAQCRMEQTGRTAQGEDAMAMHVVKLPEPQTLDGQELIAVGSFFVPLGVLLEPGLSLQVDSAEPLTAPFLACQPSACIVRVQLNEQLVDSFRRGARARFGFSVLQNDQAVPIEATISLSGFTRAYNSLP